MANLIGLVVTMLVSFTAFPLVMYVTTSQTLTEPFTLMCIGLGFTAATVIAIAVLLKPSGIKNSPNIEGRGLIYYTCALFMWASVADITLQLSHYGFFMGYESNTEYFTNGELYLMSPVGISTQWWNAVMHYIMYVFIIYRIDNNQDPRNVALYWCGSICTSQFVLMVGIITGVYSSQLEWSVWMNVTFVVFPLWVLCKFLTKPRNDFPDKVPDNRHHSLLDVILSIYLVAASALAFVRAIAAMGSELSIFKSYAMKYEPHLLDPTHFGMWWALYVAMYGIPFQLGAVYGLLRPGKKWMLDLSVYYAAGILQGTVVFTSYSWYSHSEEKFQIPNESRTLVLGINAALILFAHLLMFRCISNPGYFMPKNDVDNKKDK